MVFKFKMQWVLFCLLLTLFNTRALALDNNTKSALDHYIMAVMYDDLGETSKAIQEYKKSLRFDSQNALAHFNLAVSYIKNNQTPEAEKELNQAIEISPESVEPRALLALLYSSQQKVDLAAREYEVALENATHLEPRNIGIYKDLGAVYLQQKKFEAAQKTYQLVLDITPLDPEAYFYLAHSYYGLKNKNAAIRYLKKTLELKPDYAEALNYLGYLYVEEGRNLGKSEAMIRKALEIDPDNGAYVDSLGWLYFKKGKLKEAKRELEKANKLMEDPVIYDHLGDVCFKLGDKAGAELNWQKALKMDPGLEKVSEKLTGINKK